MERRETQKTTILVVILTLISLSIQGQDRNYNFYHLSSDDDLPTNDFQFTYQDSYGFLWLASYDGLFRWDGYSVKKYYHNEADTGSLGHNIVYSVFEDAKRQLWIGTIEGLNLYDRTTDGFIRCKIGLNGQKIPVNAIVADSKNQLWLGTSFGLCRYDHATRHAEWHSNQSTEDVIFSMAIDSHDDIWLGTFNQGVRKFSTSKEKFSAFRRIENNPATIISNKIKSLRIDHKGNVWVGTADKGITVLNKNGKFVRHYTDIAKTNSGTQSPINCMYEDRNHTMWVGMAQEDLYYISEEGASPQSLDDPITGNTQSRLRSVSSICEDSFGNIWFATTGNGLFYTNAGKNVFENYLKTTSSIKGLESTTTTCFYEDAHGNIWLGTDGSGLIKFNPVSRSFVLYKSRTHNFTSDAINDIKGDDQGYLWISTWHGGVMQFDPRTEKVKSYVNDPSNTNSLILNDAKTLLIDDTLIWIGTHGEGLVAIDRKRNKLIDHTNNTSIPFELNAPAWINHLYKDSRHRLWISTYSGLFVYDGKSLNHFSHTNDTASISSNSVNMIAEDNTGVLWVVSESGGLDRFNEQNKNFSRFTEKLSLPETMKGIVADNLNTLWITSNEGVFALDKTRTHIKRFDASEGLQGNTFFQKAVLRTKAGRLIFGGPRGFNVFHPDSLRNLTVPSKFYFTDLYIYSQKQDPRVPDSPLEKVLPLVDQLTLTHEQSFFSIEFAAINFYTLGKTQYEYKLDGLHDQWIALQKERKVSFTNLDPGNYTLHVRYTDISGEWSVADNALHITVLPPWWKTVWFRLLIILTIISGIVAVFYLRVNAIKKRNKFLKEEVERRTHELSEVNYFLMERNEEISLQKERLEVYNVEILRQSDKILEQQMHISGQNEKLEHHVEELQKLNKTKDHFFSILAHDLKNPISALTGISDFVKNNFSKLDKKDAQEYINSIYKSAYSIYDLLLNLLNWSQTQSKTIAYAPSSLNVKEVVQKNAILLDQQFRNKHITLNVDVDPEHYIFADYNMMDTAVRNILSNSIKFTEYNGTVTVSSIAHDDDIVLSIADTGVGMSSEEIKGLFKLDKANISTGTAGERGTGLGLVITHDFIEANKGKINVESEPGKGTTFHLALPKSISSIKVRPKRQDLSPPPLDIWEALPMEKLVKIKGKKILIVDDNRELRSYLKLLLSETFEIFEAENGKEGMVVALEAQPTAIISDVIMPNINGIQFCKDIKSTTATSHISVILLTSVTEEKGQLEGYEAGADAYLSKPVRKEILIQVILNLIQNQEKLRDRMRESILNGNTVHTEDLAVNKRDEEFLNRLIDFINNNIADATLDARNISEEFGISRSVLYTKIKALTGQSVHEFVKSIRLKQSLKLLLEGRHTISQVALEVGFNSHSYFDKCFVKQYGVGPKEYVAKRKKG
jgi:ligand-binding sensor domain-containing protein/signal transduction histidine kinase/CheY-like chemotaxis protein/AraC-like DNA-binding protein